MSSCDDDFELENLRLAALKSMQSKATKIVSSNKSSIGGFTNNSNNVQISIDGPSTAERTFVNKKSIRKNFSKNNSHQFNQPSHPQFHNQHSFSNQPTQFQSHENPTLFNNQPPVQQPFAGGSKNNGQQPGFVNDLQQYFNQFNNEQFSNNVPQKFNKINNPQQFNQSTAQQQFNHNQPSQFINTHHPQSTPKQYKNTHQPPQFAIPPPQFNQPRSNLIVLTDERREAGNEHHQIPNYMPPPNHQQMNPHYRNGYSKPMNRDRNKKFHNKQFNATNQNEMKPKDVPTDANKNSDSLPSRFSRIDRDSSSDEDEESDSDDSDIEKYRQTYFDANEDTQKNMDQQSETSKEDREEELTKCSIGQEDTNKIFEASSRSDEECKHVKVQEIKDQFENDDCEKGPIDDLQNKMVLRNKKRVSDPDSSTDESRQAEKLTDIDRNEVKARENENTVLDDNLMTETNSNEDSRPVRRTSRRLSSNFDYNVKEVTSEPAHPKLKSRAVKVINDEQSKQSSSLGDTYDDYNRSAKRLRSLVVKK